MTTPGQEPSIGAAARPTQPSPTYARLAAPFDATFHDNRGGVELEYVTGEQVVSRLNAVLGPENWSFRVIEHGTDPEADEIWVLAHLEAEIDGKTITRQQFGSQKIKRSRSSNIPLDIGFDKKGATTDALKKCATLIGVALYLSHKEEQRPAGQAPAAATAAGPATAADGPLSCADCGATLKETRFKDGTTWGPGQLASYGRRKHNKVLCMDHYRAANEARASQLLSA